MGQDLSKSDINAIQEKVNMKPERFKQWYTEYKKSCKQEDTLNKEEFKDIYKKMFHGNAAEFAENVFRTFDLDGNDRVDFGEFMIGVGITINNDQEKKLEWAFKLYDIDGNGTIDKKEMQSIVKSIYAMGKRVKSDSEDLSAEEMALKMFEKMDINNDGVISWEEFKEGALKDPLMKEVLDMKFA